MSESFDIHAFVRAAVISVAAGMLVGSLIYFALKTKDQWTKWRSAVILGVLGLVLLAAAGMYYSWPSLVVTPSLDGLSQAEAETLLVKMRLVPNGRPQYSFDVPVGRVIPHSQSPGHGLPVQPGATVTFAICARQESAVVIPPAGDVNVSLFRPKGGDHADCRRSPDGVYRVQVEGTASGVSDNGRGLLLWLRPVNPPSDTAGWYLQRPPTNGVVSVASNGSWEGLAQIGNAQWPPQEGNSFDIAVTIADRRVINDLVAEPGVVIRNAPVGLKSDVASGVLVTLR